MILASSGFTPEARIRTNTSWSPISGSGSCPARNRAVLAVLVDDESLHGSPSFTIRGGPSPGEEGSLTRHAWRWPHSSATARFASAFATPCSSSCVGKVAIRHGAGQLQCPDHPGERREDADARRGRIIGFESCRDDVDDTEQTVGVGPPDHVVAAADLIEQGRGRASLAGVIAMLDRQVPAHQLLDVRSRQAEPRCLALAAELLGDHAARRGRLSTRSARRTRRWSARRRP